MWGYISQAGLIGYVLVGLSVLSLGVIIERAWFWVTRGGHLRDSVRAAAVQAFHSGKTTRLDDVLSGTRSPEADALRFIAQYREEGSEAAVEIALSREVEETNRWLLVLDVNGVIAPMLGILGTVTGIIQAFKGMKGSTPDTAVMITGLSVSMLTTAIGLIVALINIIPYNVLAGKAHRAQTRLAVLLQECWIRNPTVEKSGTGDGAEETPDGGD